MSSELMMDSGIAGKTKLMILSGVVIAFALTIGILMRPGKDAQVAGKPKPAVAQNAHAALPEPIAEQAISGTQLATTEKPAQTTTPTDATTAVQTDATVQPPQPNEDVAAYAPPPASVSVSAESQDASGWNEASVDDRNIDAPDQEVAAQTPVSQPRPVVRPPPPPAIDALHPWWRDPTKQQGFDVQYVGQAASEKALVFRFSKSIADTQAAAQHIRVTDGKGEATTGVWVAGNNPYVLVYQGVPSGRYIVSIDATLASASGAMLGSPLQGPVYVN